MTFIHPTSDVQCPHIGDGTRIWQFVVILPGARIGRNCNINCSCFIENDVSIGDDVTIKSGVYVWDGITIEDGAFIGPCVAFTNDRFPRSKHYPDVFLRTIVHRKASIGANSTILPGLSIGDYALIGAGSVLTKHVPAHEIWVGNPARHVGYACECGAKLGEQMRCASCAAQYESAAPGLRRTEQP